MSFPNKLRHLVFEVEDKVELSRLTRLKRLQALRVSRRVVKCSSTYDEPEDYSFLSSLTSLERLELVNEPIEDLGVLLPLQKLRFLSVEGTLVKDVDLLLDLPLLEYVDLKSTSKMSDVCSVLRQHTHLRRLRRLFGYHMIAPFTREDLSSPPSLLHMLSTLFDGLH